MNRMPAANTSSHDKVKFNQPFNEVDKSTYSKEVKYRIWLVFKLFAIHVPVPNGELEIEDVAALFDQLTEYLETGGQSRSINLRESGGEDHV